MNLAVVHSRASVGIEAVPVIIEVHLSPGLPGLNIVGLPETAVKESRHRVRSAIVNSGFEFPVRRITVNLAPADLPKEGGRFDVPIALGILAASGQIPAHLLSQYEIVGELALSGEVRPCQGILPSAIAARTAQRHLIIPASQIHESALVNGLTCYGVRHLTEICGHLTGRELLQPQSVVGPSSAGKNDLLDLAQVYGQAHGRRALEIVAAGGHSLLMVGAPGSGKTMLAARLPGILPPLTETEALEVASIYSLTQRGFDFNRWAERPFRAPHHTASGIALTGGGNPPRPGEISLAHRGVLFLDELPEFSRVVLEVLREPLEAGEIAVSRACHQAVFPARFQLVAAMNPCPCGYHGDEKGRCHCTLEQIQRYQHKISGPLLDRIDMHLTIQALPSGTLLENHAAVNETSAQVRERVKRTREIQQCRQQKINADLTQEELSRYCALNVAEQKLLMQAVDSLALSARAYHRILRLARTIADLEQAKVIAGIHLQEAIGYRMPSSFLRKS